MFLRIWYIHTICLENKEIYINYVFLNDVNDTY